MTWSVNKLQYKQSKRKCESCPVSCNQSPTYTKVLLTIYNNCLQNLSHSLQQYIPPEYTVILTTWLSNLTVLSVHNDKRTCHCDALACSLTQIFTFEKQTKDFEQENGFCMKSMVFCYLYELFWEMHLLFCKFQFWSEKCTKATEKNCNTTDYPIYSTSCLPTWYNNSNTALPCLFLIRIACLLNVYSVWVHLVTLRLIF